jgi:hypothetical protein
MDALESRPRNQFKKSRPQGRLFLLSAVRKLLPA